MDRDQSNFVLYSVKKVSGEKRVVLKSTRIAGLTGLRRLDSGMRVSIL
jgi:hypothetical protein